MIVPTPVSPRRVEHPEGLRARKREATRASIQDAALVLFSRNGYEATTMEQIAQTVGISTRSVHRYFPRKQDMVTYDRFNPVLSQYYRALPPEMPPIKAFREALDAIIRNSAVDGHVSGRARLQLLLNRSLAIGGIADYIDTQRFMATLVAERMPGHTAEQVRVVAAAVTGIVTMVAADWIDNPATDARLALDQALALLAASGLDT
jgi:AcrR family transcriptional regulator